jgi:hypothetical protein
MIINKTQQEEFEKVCRPVIKWLNDNCHPHVTVTIDCTSYELLEGILSLPVEDYIKN